MQINIITLFPEVFDPFLACQYSGPGGGSGQGAVPPGAIPGLHP